MRFQRRLIVFVALIRWTQASVIPHPKTYPAPRYLPGRPPYPRRQSETSNSYSSTPPKCITGDSRVNFELQNNNGLFDFRKNESIVCGIGEIQILFQPYDESEKNLVRNRITFPQANCIDEKTVAFTYSSERSNSKTLENRDSTKFYIEITCISSTPVTVHFGGFMPSLGNVIKAEFYSKENKFRTQIYIPHRPEKTGMYSFRTTRSHSSESREISFYLFFKGPQNNIWSHDTSIENTLNAFEDHSDPRKVVVPCRVNDPSLIDISLVATITNKANDSSRGGTAVSFDYNAKKGFVVERDVFDEVFVNAIKDANQATIVYCNSQNGTSAAVKVKVYLTKYEYEPISKMMPGNAVSWDFDTASSFKSLKCKLKPSGINDMLYVASMYLASVGEYSFLDRCLPKGKNCQWNSFWPPNKESVFHFSNGSNKVVRECGEQSTDLSDSQIYIKCSISKIIFNSGVAMCSNEKDEDHVVELYFTGLDEKFYCLSALKLIPATTIIRVAYNSLSESGSKLYSSQTKTFFCTSVSFLVLKGLSWSIYYADGTRQQVFSSDRKDFGTFTPQIYNESVDIILHENMVKVVCRGYLRGEIRDDMEYVESSVVIQVEATQPPVLLKTRSRYIVSENDSSLLMNCFVRAVPIPRIAWHFNKKAVEASTRFSAETDGSWRLELKLDNLTNTLTPGDYLCFAENVGGFDYAYFHCGLTTKISLRASKGTCNSLFDVEFETESTTSPEPMTGFTPLSLGLICVVIVILAIGSAVLLRAFRFRSTKVLSDNDLDNFFHGTDGTLEQKEYHNYACLPYKEQNELSLKDFRIDYEKILGEGFYGKVLMGSVRGKDAAAKTVRESIQREEILALLTEIKIMSRLDEHPNIVSFIGASTKRLASGEVYLFVEFCPGGSVENYLRGIRKTNSALSNSEVKYENQISQKLLLDWSLQTAQGMEYLSSMNIIHGDLAVRNLLLKNINAIKISDFGLARQLHNYSVYAKKSTHPLPWRHMAPESLANMEFSVKSDVWAFGVTLWEIYSLGLTPYPGAQWNQEFIAALKDGMNLQMPIDCLNDVCTVMKKCWMLLPAERADFNELSTALGILKESLRNDHVYCIATACDSTTPH